MSTTITKNNVEQQTNSNRSSYVHLFAGGYEEKRISQNSNIFIHLVLPGHLVRC
jgi:hypothetical protein